MRCGKKPYPTRAIAKAALKRLNKTKGFTLTDVYFCNDCNNWHTTHTPKKQSRRMKKKNYAERISQELKELREQVRKKGTA